MRKPPKKTLPENDVRDRALANCHDADMARAAWARVRADGRCHGKTSRAARLAMLTALAEGKTVDAAEKAGWAVLES